MNIAAHAVIPRDKLTGYLLVFRPKSDKSKFLAQAGFTSANPDLLEQAIRKMLMERKAVVDQANEYGVFYRVEGELVGPHGILPIVTVWLRQESTGLFRFVTLKPAR
jgi:hypothetical protein